MTEYASRIAYTALIETMEIENLLTPYMISSIMGLPILAILSLFFNTKTRLGWLTTNFILGYFFTHSMGISGRIWQIASEMKSADLDFHWVMLPCVMTCMVTLTFVKFAAALTIIKCICKIDLMDRDRGVLRIFRNSNFFFYCVVPSYIIFHFFKINLINYIDPFTIMKIIRIASLLLTIIAQISSKNKTYSAELITCCAIINFIVTISEGLIVRYLLKIKYTYICAQYEISPLLDFCQH